MNIRMPISALQALGALLVLSMPLGCGDSSAASVHQVRTESAERLRARLRVEPMRLARFVAADRVTGTIGLSGVVVNASIVMVDSVHPAQHRLSHGVSDEERTKAVIDSLSRDYGQSL